MDKARLSLWKIVLKQQTLLYWSGQVNQGYGGETKMHLQALSKLRREKILRPTRFIWKTILWKELERRAK